MRIKVSNNCNVVTEEHSTAYRTYSAGGLPRPQITIPMWGKRLSIEDAESLGVDLLRAVAEARKHEKRGDV